ncbi:GAF domain-containing protein [Paenibacillus mesophilus]|uniref:protein kinase domain-containing protein n=1 Tax=Paenibacillus mesophilus TaxID=2582849 RepID=UPI00110E5351|nr:LuxR C-terminal-related transcriptional regulator [Paenibacillus mesophilus]TMV48017.1 GAF domain-containing protein [Paenibacillus mesophilus]
MVTTPGYRYLHLVYEDDNIWICYAYSEALSRVVLWKMVKDGPRTMIENAKLIHEYETLSLLRMDGVLKPHTLLRQGGSMVLLFDIINGIVLRQYMAAGPIEPIYFLKIAVRAVEIVEELHRQELLHMNLRPDTILLVPESMQVCLTGFSDTVPIRQSLHATRLEGYPPYMAPERTNGARQLLDGRTDLYSLGVTFFEMLAGELPFQAKESLEWAHAHIAKQPPSLSDKYGVPRLLAAIVSKLLAKAPEGRYQSATGLKGDLQRCLDQLEGQGELEEFQLGLLDKPIWNSDVERDEGNSELQLSDVVPVPARLLDEVAGISPAPIRQIGVTPFSDSGYTQMLDLAAVFKASQIFASVGDPQERVRQLLLLLLEQAGASRGCWVSHRRGRYIVELAAAWTLESGWSYESAHVPLERFPEASHEIIHAAEANRTVVCLGDAAVTGSFMNTEYVRRTGLRSVLCCPIPTGEEILTLLYVENHLSANAFSTERVGVLRMVAMQLFYANRLTASDGRELPPPVGLGTESELTARELEVLELMAAGLSNKEIAARLVVAAETVKAHIRNIFGKLEVSKRIQAVEAGRMRGLIPQTGPLLKEPLNGV